MSGRFSLALMLAICGCSRIEYGEPQFTPGLIVQIEHEPAHVEFMHQTSVDAKGRSSTTLIPYTEPDAWSGRVDCGTGPVRLRESVARQAWEEKFRTGDRVTCEYRERFSVSGESRQKVGFDVIRIWPKDAESEVSK